MRNNKLLLLLGIVCLLVFFSTQGLFAQGQFPPSFQGCNPNPWFAWQIHWPVPCDYGHIQYPLPAISLEKCTNGEDVDWGFGPLVQAGSVVTWSYEVTNTGNVPVFNIMVFDNKEGFIGTIDVLEAGEKITFYKEGVAVVGLYSNFATASGYANGMAPFGTFCPATKIPVFAADCSRYVGECRKHCDPDDFAVLLSFKDSTGNYVGDVLAYMYAPGDDKASKSLSLPTEYLAGDLWPCNAFFRSYSCIIGGTYKFEFKAPDGWQFVSPNTMELEVPDHQAFYSVKNEFILEKLASTNTNVTDQPEIPADAVPGQLYFVQGTPTARGEGWEKAVDGILDGWKGTATIKHDETNAEPFGIFRIAGDGLYQFDRIMIQTDNGVEDNEWSDRQATLVDVQVSVTGKNPEDFTSVKQLTIKSPELTSYNLGFTVEAKYIKLVMLQPSYTSYVQIVEFGVGNSHVDSALPASDGMQISAVPSEFTLEQNYPNPFNPVTMISYNLPTDAQVKLTIFDVSGKEVAVLADEFQSSGSHNVRWNASGNPSGLYFYTISAGSFSKTLRMVLMK